MGNALELYVDGVFVQIHTSSAGDFYVHVGGRPINDRNGCLRFFASKNTAHNAAVKAVAKLLGASK